MKLRFSALLCALWLPLTCSAAGLGDPEVNVPQRLVEASLGQAVPANDPRIAPAREQLAKAVKATGEGEQGVLAACLRVSRYIFDVAKVKATPLEILDALAKHAPAGKPLNETTERYFNLRAKQRLNHAETMAQLAAGK